MQNYRFRLSRFGCVFICQCPGKFLSLAKVLERYVHLLESGANHLDFVPQIEFSSGLGTMSIKKILLELNYLSWFIEMKFLNFSLYEENEILECLSPSIQSHARSRCIPTELLSLLLVELESASSSCGFVFYTCPPPKNLLRHLEQRSTPTHGMIDELLPSSLLRTLYPHQVEGIKKILSMGGRALLADEMGVGKTLECIGAVAALKGYPLLLVAPSALKLMWAEKVEQYLYSDVGIGEICVVKGINDIFSFRDSLKVVIISYHMAVAAQDILKRYPWKCVVSDEAHFLHTNVTGVDATYTSLICQIAKNTQYCLFLTGTPATASPFDLFNILDAIMPDFFGICRWDFALRYCRIRCSPFVKVLECVRLTELSTFLRCKIMIRRTKEMTLALPLKLRTVLRVSDPQSVYSLSGFQKAYAMSWHSKLDGIFRTVYFCATKFVSVVCFAHHLELLDRLESFFIANGISYVRIDGTVNPNARKEILLRFSSRTAKIALMGITASSVGIDLSTAECGVFCELPPDTAWLLQAEDRLHRPGQKNTVHIYYVLGIYSRFDERHFNHLRKCFRDSKEVLNKNSESFKEYPSSCGLDNKKLYSIPFPPKICDDPCAVSWFAFSRNTGRLHVCVMAGDSTPPTFFSAPFCSIYYTSMTIEEAQECIRSRSPFFWCKLQLFLSSFLSLSPYQRRMFLRASKCSKSQITTEASCCQWSREAIQWNAKGYSPSGKTSRYKRCRDKDDEYGWGCWFQVQKRVGKGKIIYYFNKIELDFFSFTPTCMNCFQPLSHLIEMDAFDHNSLVNSTQTCFPGCIIHVHSDASLFCDGDCREQYFVRKSSAAVRFATEAADAGVCSSCHVDCERLRQDLISAVVSSDATSEENIFQVRRKLVERHHPLMMFFPNLVERAIRTPVAGNLWHADHILPVSQGGGECTLENIQTLCVACHQLKTKEDLKRLKICKNRNGNQSDELVPNTSCYSNARNDRVGLLNFKPLNTYFLSTAVAAQVVYKFSQNVLVANRDMPTIRSRRTFFH